MKARKKKSIQQTQSYAFKLSQKLENLAEEKFRAVTSALNNELKQIELSYFAMVERSVETNAEWFRQQVVHTAKILEYYADTRTYHSWIRLKIKEDRQTEITLSFHALGAEFFGIMAASAFIEYRDKIEQQEVIFDKPDILCSEIFQFSYTEQENFVTQRFQSWLENILLAGLDQWKNQL